MHLFLFGCTAFPVCCSLQPKHVPRMWVSHEHSCPITWAFGTPNSCWDKNLTHRISQLSLVATNPANFVSNLPFKLCFPWVFCGFFPVFSTVSLPHCQHCAAAKVNADIAAAAIARALEADEFAPWQFQRRPGRGTNQDFRLVTWEFMGFHGF